MNAEISKLLCDCLEKKVGEIFINSFELKAQKLFGPGALLESLDFINFIVDVEEEISKRFNKNLNLRKSVLDKGTEWLRTFGSFEQFLEKELNE
jgi:acyl carrier protein